jgi:hypothetical protein
LKGEDKGDKGAEEQRGRGSREETILSSKILSSIDW